MLTPEGSNKDKVLCTTNSVKIRSTAGTGTLLAETLNDEILIRISSVSSQKALDTNGVERDWINVRYFAANSEDPNTWGWIEGWAAEDFTDEVSKNTPGKNDVHCSNDYLRQAKMLTNARYVHAKLSDAGWTNNAIYGVLGNMETESNINPQFWQRGATIPGYGLVQWTPSSHLIDWANRRGLDPNDIDVQLERIKFEVLTNDDENPEHDAWQKNNHELKITFEEFTKSNETPECLADVFLLCYERYGTIPILERSKQARKWHDILELLK